MTPTIIYRPAGDIDDIVTEHGLAMVAVLDAHPERVLVMGSEQATNYLRESLPQFLADLPPTTWPYSDGMRYVWAKVETHRFSDHSPEATTSATTS